MSCNDDVTTLRCWAEIRSAALRANLAAIRARVPLAGVMAVVKANGYGHGLALAVSALDEGAAMFGVANLNEAREAARHTRKPVLLLGAALPAERRDVVCEGFIPVVSGAAEAAEFAAHGKVRVHLAVDTGMGRMGAWENDAPAEARKIAAMPGVEFDGVCSHLPSADSDDDFTRAQLARFHALVAKLAADGIRPPHVHVENSAGAIAFPEYAGTLIRAGLALYGVAPRAGLDVMPALTWKTRVILVRDFPAGHGVSYGRTFVTTRPMRVATLAAGYADGYPRQLSGRGAHVLIGGRRCAVLGRVTMDQIMADVSGIEAAPGDEAVLLGRQGNEKIAIEEIAEWAGTIAWDIFTGIGPRVVRRGV